MLRNVHEIKIQKRRLCFWKSFVYILFYKELILYFRRPNLMNLNRVAELPTAGLNLSHQRWKVKEEFESVIQIRTGDRQFKFTKFGPGLSKSVRQLTYKCIFFQNYLNFVFTKLFIKIKYKLGVGDPGTWSLISSIKLFISAEN